MSDVIKQAREILRLEAGAIGRLADGLGADFERAVDAVVGCKGRVVTTGMGKIGIVAQKVSATLASTGTPSVYLHPAEAVHGDLGRVVKGDVILAFSNSGETEEVLRLLEVFKRIETQVIAVTSRPKSTLARHSNMVLDLGSLDEACPLGLAPTTSTTVALALGDAVAMCALSRKKFSREDYARFHPAGELGRRLLKVEDIMRTGGDVVAVSPDTTVRKALIAISRAPQRAGAVLVADGRGRLLGIFTDGDLRRHLEGETEFLDKPISAVMVADPKSVRPGQLATEALAMMKKYRIDDLPVTDGDGAIIGILDIQDMIAVGIPSA